jgi:hypothetical protein
VVSVSSSVGAALGVLTRAAGAVRPADKPLHPRGAVRRGTLRRTGLDPAVGVAFLDDAGEDAVVVRESRAAGLPAPLPDVHGLALRVLLPTGPGDVLMNTAGFGRWTRYALVPTRTAYARPLSTLIPYRTVAGPVLLGVRAVDEDRLELVAAVDGGPFRAFGAIELGPRHEDQDVSFDPVAHTLPGLEQYDAVRRLRAPSYAAARSSRHEH